MIHINELFLRINFFSNLSIDRSNESLSVRLLNDPQKDHGCAPAAVTKYQKRISGPLLDRIDIHIEVPCVDYEKLIGDRMGVTSEEIRARVQTVHNNQQQRFANNGSCDIICNADMRVGDIRQFCKLQDEGQRLMRAAGEEIRSTDWQRRCSTVRS